MFHYKSTQRSLKFTDEINPLMENDKKLSSTKIQLLWIIFIIIYLNCYIHLIENHIKLYAFAMCLNLDPLDRKILQMLILWPKFLIVYYMSVAQAN